MSNGRLVLTRRSGEALTVNVNGEEFQISIVQIQGNQVRVMVDADRDAVSVTRSELLSTGNSQV